MNYGNIKNGIIILIKTGNVSFQNDFTQKKNYRINFN